MTKVTEADERPRHPGHPRARQRAAELRARGGAGGGELRMRRAVRARLPRFLKPLFQEYDFRDLSWDEDRDLIIGRVLARGDWPSVQWLRGQAGAEGLREWILRRKGRGLDPRRLRFWELILDLPRRDVDEWIREMNRDGWHRRVAR